MVTQAVLVIPAVPVMYKDPLVILAAVVMWVLLVTLVVEDLLAILAARDTLAA
jgi:hypothetical protein